MDDEFCKQTLNINAQHKEILSYLHEIFDYTISEKEIFIICSENNWAFDTCVQKLIDFVDRRSSTNCKEKIQTEMNENMNLHSMTHFSGAENSSNSTKEPQGAIPKCSTSNVVKGTSSSSFIPKINPTPTLSQHFRRQNKNHIPEQNIEHIIDHINNGNKIMIIMRGAPGSGKTFLARKIIDSTTKQEYQNFIFSTDDYFCTGNRYIYQIDKLSEAHEFNQNRVRLAALNDWSPIIVDNTNIKIWEMLPYVKIALQKGYMVELLEAKTPWSNSASKLALKNQHGVPKTRIEISLNNFEPITSEEIIKIIQRKQNSMAGGALQIPLKNTVLITKINKNDVSNEQESFQNSNESKKIVMDNLLNSNKKMVENHVTSSEDNIDNNTIEANNSEQLQPTENLIHIKEENSQFQLLRQIYPQKNINELWNLFQKCKGNIDWVIDILLKEVENDSEKKVDSECNNVKNNTNYLDIPTEENFVNQPFENTLEKSISDNYSNIFPLCDNFSNISKFNMHEQENDLLANQEASDISDGCNANSTNDDNLLIEIKLGKVLIQQLENIFDSESSENSFLNYESNVLMPKILAKQLYALWMQSKCNQNEEKKIKLIKEDEEFARLVDKITTESEYFDNIETEMERALFLYKSDPNHKFDVANTENLASHLTRLKLYETFPEIEKETLLEIYQANNYNFESTISLLKNSMNIEDDTKVVNTNDVSPKKVENKKNNIVEQKKVIPEIAKRAALRDFEENRNLAAHHSQLKAECYEKAKEAIQQNNTSVAVYYSQIADLHKSKIDMYNHNAANSIIKVNDLTQNNPDFIDLHYLHTTEALECLDIFFDKHIRKLRCTSRIYKYIFVITGRGLHSAGGVSSIKNNVKTRLKERNLKWSEVNPGLLKVKIFSASKFSENC